jgi:hypothetical protein
MSELVSEFKSTYVVRASGMLARAAVYKKLNKRSTLRELSY